MPPTYSIITTCKGRLHNLQQSLPEFLKQKDSEVIVVDYDCPDGTTSHVVRHYPSARIVSVADQPRFNAAHARNLGARIAKGDVLIFLDADVIVTEGFVNAVSERIAPQSFALFGTTAGNSLRGSCVVSRVVFEKIGGYDELLAGYEGEDLDLYMRLRLSGQKQILLDRTMIVDTIEQSVSEKERFRAPDLKLQFLRGQLYISIKEMIMSAQGTLILPQELLRHLLAEIEPNLMALYNGEKDFALEVNLPDKYKRGFLKDWEFSRAVSVKARRKQPDPTQ